MRAYLSHGIDDDTVQIIDSNDKRVTSNNLDDILDFLLDPEPTRNGSFRVTWDLDQFVAPILHIMPKGILETLWTKGRCYVFPYSIAYNPAKSFVVKKGRWRAAYYHLAQFFADNDKPQSLAQTVSLGEKLISELLNIGIRPHRLTSSVALLDDLWDRYDLPNYMDLPDDVGQMAWDCSGKLWIEAHQLGHFDKAWDYDLNSSFPWAASLLYDLRYGEWIDAMYPPQNSAYGFVEGMVTINHDISPIAERDASGHYCHPKGTWKTTLSLQEMAFLRDFPQIGSFKPSSGWYWVCDPKLRTRTLAQLINSLFQIRKRTVVLDKILKRAAVGLYGKFLQTYDDGTFAPNFNPVYGSVIENLVKLRLAREIHHPGSKIPSDLLHIATDGILTSAPHPEILSNSMALGSWRLDSTGPALVISSGCLYYGDKRPNQITYSEAMEMIRCNPDEFEWSTGTTRTMTLGDHVQGVTSKIGQEVHVTTGFSIPLEHDRNFSKMPRTGYELLTKNYPSTALKIGQVKYRDRAKRGKNGL